MKGAHLLRWRGARLPAAYAADASVVASAPPRIWTLLIAPVMVAENPAFESLDHCIAVRTASRPDNDRSSPMPISSPYMNSGVPGKENSRL